MSAAFQKLRSKLSELFQLDAAAELDFGIYRILNARRVEISEFLDSLEGQVDRILAEAMGSGAGEVKAELAKAEADLRSMGLDDDAVAAVPKIRELRGKIATGGSDPTALSHEIFSHLATFFSRYYQDGDFISLRRYKKDTYAIPYEGEEVKLHWANADQYYIKSSETLRDYSFRLGPAPKNDKPDTRPTVTFKLVEADIEKDNAKAVAGQERRFVFQGVVDSDSKDHLVLGFAYLPLGKAEKQAALNEAAAKAILTDHAKGAFTDLAAKDPSYTGSQKGGRSILAKHLAEYTGRNTFDYFVHKDLGGFLRRELDFYIKNEVLHLDDLDEAPVANWNETRAKLKALRTIAAKVIRFLAQLEDFQKKLWLKKKFVTACDYVVTLDRIPEELYPEIAACDAQREEWVRLFAIDEIKGDLGRTGYSVPLTVEFLKENQNLAADTSNLPDSLAARVALTAKQIASSSVAKSDSATAMTLFQAAVSNQITTIFTDPPYNTGVDGFPYKDSYQHSSWLSMILDRFILGKSLMSQTGLLFATIDFVEVSRFRVILDRIFGEDGFLADIAWEKRYTRSNNAKRFYSLKDTVLAYRKSSLREEVKELRSEKSKGNYTNPDNDKRGPWISSSYVNPATKEERRNLCYAIENPFTKVSVEHPTHAWKYDPETNAQHIADKRLYWGEDGGYEYPRLKSFLSDAKQGMVPVDVWKYDETGTTDEGGAVVKALFGSEVFKNPKPTRLIERCIKLEDDLKPTVVLDFFAGSGTTGHAVINLNREDGGDRKYILIEMGEHFDTVLVPRLKKVIYSSDWKDGKPQNRNTGISHCFKILRLESYEDTLNNLRLSRTRSQELALEAMTPEAREDYRLGYMLDLEASGSQSLLNVSAFTDPWNYTMEIATGTAGETKTTKVDLVETFNWLLGLTILAQGHGGGVQWVEGTNPEGDKVLVLWRNTTEVDADALNDWCKKQKISVLDGEFGLIYVNGDHHLENLRREDQTWKVRLTDEEFPKLMWEGCE
ncbi:MAG: site-specific DNA-methyltransferase [Akkermansiaceae bacterium]|jgi:adenine-specific DNA-methyltransferase|nr:site-specific DNA-methyltransferase [Akkermansiaceae bacterium]